MGFRYRKSIRLGGGFRINISGSGVGYSWGVPGYRITKTANGKIRQTASIPGTGLSYSTEESIYKSARKSSLKEEPYTDTEVIQSTDRADYKDSDFKALMKRILLFWWPSESGTPFPLSCGHTPICTPISSGNSCQGWKLSVLPLPPRMNPI